MKLNQPRKIERAWTSIPGFAGRVTSNDFHRYESASTAVRANLQVNRLSRDQAADVRAAVALHESRTARTAWLLSQKTANRAGRFLEYKANMVALLASVDGKWQSGAKVRTQPSDIALQSAILCALTGDRIAHNTDRVANSYRGQAFGSVAFARREGDDIVVGWGRVRCQCGSYGSGFTSAEHAPSVRVNRRHLLASVGLAHLANVGPTSVVTTNSPGQQELLGGQGQGGDLFGIRRHGIIERYEVAPALSSRKTNKLDKYAPCGVSVQFPRTDGVEGAYWEHGADIAACRAEYAHKLDVNKISAEQARLNAKQARAARLVLRFCPNLPVRYADARAVGHCDAGIRGWCQRHGIDPNGPMTLGALQALAQGDGQALRVAERVARECAAKIVAA